MINFQYVRAATVPAALDALAETPGAQLVAGGTNLVDLMKKGVANPPKLVDITQLARQGFNRIHRDKRGLRIGALALNADVADDPVVRTSEPLLAQALAAGASPQIRNMASVGGNLLQRTRCPYFYNLDMPCNKRSPGSGCGALQGFNRMHAIFGASEHCIAVHPSDMAVALAALDATVVTVGRNGEKRFAIDEFYRLPADRPELDTNLPAGHLITEVEIPKNPFGRHVHYLKLRDRASYAFALVSVAAALDLDGRKIRDVRLAMGGVAHKPWRLREAEMFLKGKTASEEHFRAAAELALRDARGHGENDFKLKLAPNAVVEALRVAAL